MLSVSVTWPLLGKEEDGLWWHVASQNRKGCISRPMNVSPSSLACTVLPRHLAPLGRYLGGWVPR